jgi:hypothetical protein
MEEYLRARSDPVFHDCPQQKIRNTLLEVLNRLPNGDVLKEHVGKLLSLAMEIVK